MEKAQHLKKILELEAQAADLQTQADKLAREFARKYCPYKVKQKILIKPTWGAEETVIIESISYSRYSDMEGFSSLSAIPLTKSGLPARRRRRIVIRTQKTILKVIA